MPTLVRVGHGSVGCEGRRTRRRRASFGPFARWRNHFVDIRKAWAQGDRPAPRCYLPFYIYVTVSTGDQGGPAAQNHVRRVLIQTGFVERLQGKSLQD